MQEVNPNTHQRTTYPRHSQQAMSSPHTSTQNAPFVESDAELEYASETESETEPESDPDKEYVIENQFGLPDYQYGVYESSPPPVDANVNRDCDKLNNKGEHFLKERFAKLSVLLAEVACRVEISADEGDDSGVGVNTDIELSLGDKVRTTS